MKEQEIQVQNLAKELLEWGRYTYPNKKAPDPCRRAYAFQIKKVLGWLAKEGSLDCFILVYGLRDNTKSWRKQLAKGRKENNHFMVEASHLRRGQHYACLWLIAQFEEYLKDRTIQEEKHGA